MEMPQSNPEKRIEFAGFKHIDESSMDMVKRVTDKHLRRIIELTRNLELLRITLKPIHQREKSEKYEIHVMTIDKGKIFASEVTDRNLLTAIDSALNKIINELS
jgi:ribosome-associated translation inhibitor RaiA